MPSALWRAEFGSSPQATKLAGCSSVETRITALLCGSGAAPVPISGTLEARAVASLRPGSDLLRVAPKRMGSLSGAEVLPLAEKSLLVCCTMRRLFGAALDGLTACFANRNTQCENLTQGQIVHASARCARTSVTCQAAGW